MKKNVNNLYYFGDRNYIDIATTSRCFFESFGIDPADQQIETESVRILKEIKCNGYLIEGEKRVASCLFTFSTNQTMRSYSFIETGELIKRRLPEPTYDLDKHVSILGKQARFLMPLTKVMTYNLMVLGKALIVANSKLIPRVVKTDLLFNLNDSDYASLTMEYIKLKNQFVLLLSKVDGRLHSNVIVKLLNPEKET